MSDVSNSSKRLATIGSIMLLIPALNVVGIILVLLDMRDLAKQYKNSRIYRNAIVGTLFGIFGLISITVIILSNIFPSTGVTTIISDTTTVTQQISYPLTALGIIVTFSHILLMALFYRSAFSTIASCSGKRLFRHAGNLLLIGAIVPLLCTAILLAIRYLQIAIDTSLALTAGMFSGVIVIYVAFIFMATAFSSLKQT